MNAVINTPESNPNATILHLLEETETLIKASVADNTLRAYQRALQSLTAWLSGQTLSDAVLANYIPQLHETGNWTGRRRGEVATQTPVTGNYQLPDHTSNISRDPQRG